MPKHLRTALVAAAVILCALPALCSAGVVLSGGAGVFTPYKGDSGLAGVVQVLWSPDARFRLGGELEYRNYRSSILGVHDVTFNTGSILRLIVEYSFLEEGISPYVGAGFGMDVNAIDADKVERELEARGLSAKADKVDLGLGLLGLAGVEVPLGSTVALFAEGRASVEITHGERQSDISGDSLGGFMGLGGIRFRFGGR
jgi:hypothetical protein